jgi:Ni/Fe-hydrogenase subunit HybB-like protein
MFVVMSFAYGLAIYMLVLMFSFRLGRAAHRPDDAEAAEEPARPLRRRGAVLSRLVYHLTKLYGAKNADFETFLLINGGIYTAACSGSAGYWSAACVPLGIIYHPELSKDRNWIAGACGLVIVGGLAAMYVIIIGSQAYPLEMFPGKTVLEFGAPGDVGGQVAPYAPSFPGIAARVRRRRRGHADHRGRRPGAAVPAGIPGRSGRRSAGDGSSA